MLKKLITYFLFAVLFFPACDAPRENPLDPENPDNPFTSISGIVRTVSFPNQPIANVNVFWDKANVLVKTNFSGSFIIKDVKPEEGYLYFEKQGYSPDSTKITWNDRKNISITQQLNSIPKMIDGSIISSVANRYGNIQVYKVTVNVEIVDDENDVDSVFIKNNDLEIEKVLDNTSVTVFENEFSPSELNLSSIDDVIGREFEIVAKESNGKEFNIAQLTVKRIIKESIETLSPLNNEVIQDTLTLNWRRFTPGYPFHYFLQIYTNTVEPDLVWEKNNISSDKILFDVSNPPSPGNYFWVVWAIDEFGNRARSLPATFTIE